MLDRITLGFEHLDQAVFARQMGDDHIIYALFIAPGKDYPALSRTFTQMMNSMRVNDNAAHAVNQD